MKLLDIMKKYDRCLVRESAKLTKIYNMLLKEAANSGVDLDEMDLDEETCPDCGNDPCTCNEQEEFDECGDSDKIIPECDFIQSDEVKENDMLRNRPHNAHIDDPAGVIPESEFFAEAEKNKNQTTSTKTPEENSDATTKKPEEEVVSAAEFFAEAAKEQKEENDIIPESEFFAEGADDSDFQDAAEFFSATTTEVPKKKTVKETEDLDEEIQIDPEENMISARELLAEKNVDEVELNEEEKKLEESLKSYRRANHRLFNS